MFQRDAAAQFSTTAEEDDTPREDGGGEHCYGHNMPIATSAGWSFVDLGKRKGWAKARLGELQSRSDADDGSAIQHEPPRMRHAEDGALATTRAGITSSARCT